MYVVTNMGQFTFSNAKWLAYRGLHISGMRIGEGAQLLSFSHLVHCTSISLIFQTTLIG